jgi:hypothetical protein
MRRKPLIAAGLAALAVGAYSAPPADSASGVAPSASVAAKRLATVRVAECVRSDALGRSALFSGRMRKLRGTDRMWMRFSLQSRVGHGKYHKVDAPALSHWRKSRPGVRRFTYRQRVKALQEGAVYRVAMRYRWYDSDGNRLKSAKRRSRGCDQRPDLPNLRPIGVAATKLATDDFRYTVRVANYGKAGASAVPVQLSIDSHPALPLTVGAIPAGNVVAVRFRGPRCKTQVEAKVDASNGIEESRESDNRRGASCPLP